MARTAVRLGFVPVVRPLFRGSKMGLWEASQRALAVLAPKLGFELAYISPAVGDEDVARRRAAEAQAAGLDLLLVQHTTFTSGDPLVPFLELPIPLALWAPPEVTTGGFLPQNALCGMNLALSHPVSRSLPVKWFYGAWDSQAFQRDLQVTIAALRGWRALRAGRVLWIGGPAPGYDRLRSVPDLPLKVDRVDLSAFLADVARLPDADVEERLATLDEPMTFDRDQLRGCVRVELALERAAQGYDGVALRCWPEIPDQLGTMACAAYARLEDRGWTMACEGDVGGLASQVAVAAVTEHPAVLLDLSHVDGAELLFWHCGNVSRVWAAGGTRLEPHFNRALPAVRAMRLRPGPASGLRFVEDRRAIVYAGEVSNRPDVYQGVSGWIGTLRWADTPIDGEGFVAAVLNYRLPHHFAWGLGNAEAALMELCAWLGYRVLGPNAGGRVLPAGNPVAAPSMRTN
jgi:L-fucose isomerase-like protein